MSAPIEPAPREVDGASHQPRPGTDPANRATESHADLKQKTTRGAVSSIVGQGVNFLLRIGSMVIIARLVTPEQFGLVGMVRAYTGVLNLLRD